MPKKTPRGRRSGAPDTRREIANVARTLFAENGYSSTTVRSVARAARVDPALVHHYFHSKRGLYADAMAPGEAGLETDIALHERGASDGARGEAIVRVVFEAWDRPDAAAALEGLIRSSSSDPPARDRLDALVRDAIARPLAARLDGSRALTRVRSALVAAQLVGLAWARYVAKTEPLASASTRSLARIYGAAVDAVLEGADFGGR